MKTEQISNRAQSVLNQGYTGSRTEHRAKAAENGKVEHGSIRAANLNLFDDEIANRKQKAGKDAMQFIKDQFRADNTMDKALDKCRQNRAGSGKSLNELQEGLKGLEEEKEQMKEACGGEDTEEYKTYFEENYTNKKKEWKEREENLQKDILAQNATIRGVKQEMVKNQGMLNADKAKEMTLEASGKEVMGMLVEEAEKKIDEMLKDAVEKGEEKKEETEDIEVKLEKIQMEQRKKAKDAEETSDKSREESVKTRERTQGRGPIDMDRLKEEIARQNSQILEAQKLLLEDLKGVLIDELL